MTHLDYGATQSNVRTRLGISKTTSQLLDQWASFINECEECYYWDISEYNNEITVRDQLGEMLDAPELQQFEEHQEFSRYVGELDARFRALLLPGVELPGKRSWWRSGVLRRAGCSYAEYLRSVYDINVEICNG